MNRSNSARGRGGGGNARGFPVPESSTEDIDAADGMRDEVRCWKKYCPSAANYAAS
jgi:hypothetical protein